jgi:tRNA threonylcarbamoyladenosine biosynthesis protein TsaB
VAIARDGRILQETVLAPGREHLENLAPVTQDIINQAEIQLREVDGFGVAIGPGSFSGIRVGLAAVKGIALALGKPVVSVSSLDVLAWQGLAEGEQGAAVIDARRGEIFTGVYRKDMNRVELRESPSLIRIADFGKLIERISSDGLAICMEREMESLPASSSRALDIRIVIPSASACALLAGEGFKAGQAQDVHSIAPLYIRRSDAEEKVRLQ